MLVKYIGHGDMISADWNGKRYIFSKRRPIAEIPDGLYDFIKSSNFVHKQDVVFHERPAAPEAEEESEIFLTGPADEAPVVRKEKHTNGRGRHKKGK